MQQCYGGLPGCPARKGGVQYFRKALPLRLRNIEALTLLIRCDRSLFLTVVCAEKENRDIGKLSIGVRVAIFERELDYETRTTLKPR